MTTFSTVAGNCPNVAVEVDFTNAPTNSTRVWTNITAYVRQLSYSSGSRLDELQRTQAGTLQMLLDNRDARFDPSNGASPYSPGVKRMRWVRVTGQWAGVSYPRWMGLVEAWNQNWPASGRDATVTVSASDAFLVLALHDLGNGSFPSDLTGTRAAGAIAHAGLPYQADAGISTVPSTGTITVGTSSLDMLQETTDTENGVVFADWGGTVVFQDRHHRLTASTSMHPVATIGDSNTSGLYGAGLYGAGLYGAPGEIPYSDGELDYDDSEIWPTVAVTPSGGTAEVAYNATARTDYFDRTYQRSILSGSQAEALNAAQWLVNRFSDPPPKVPQVTLLGRNAPGFWPTILSMRTSQRFTWTRRAAATISSDMFVEGFSEVITPGTDWQTSVQLSPVDNQLYWAAGVAGYSEAGVTTRLSY